MLDAMIRGHAHPKGVKRRSFIYTLERGKRYVGRVLSRIELIAWKTLEAKPLSTLVTLPNTNVHPPLYCRLHVNHVIRLRAKFTWNIIF